MFGLIPDSKTGVDKLRDQIANERLDTVNPRTYFVPDAALAKILTPEVVESIIEEIGIGWDKRDKVVKSVLGHARKIFCILVWIESLNLKSIGEIVDRRDIELPFAIEKVGRKFWEVQWEYLSPIFDGIYRHLDRNMILPFCSEKILAKDENGTLSKVEVYDIHQKTLDNLKHRSARDIGKILRVKENKEELEGRKNWATVCVAQKQLLEGEEPSQIDLGKLQSIGKLIHPHIVDLLGAYSHMGSHYVIFPYTDMNLNQFLDLDKRHPDFSTDHSFYTSIVGLCEALNSIHCYTSTSMGDVAFTSSIGYLEIKPRKILIQDGKFLLSEFGLPKAKPSGLGSATMYHSSIVTYEAPECSNLETLTTAEICHSAPIWSFGCILSEIATYMISGRQGVQEFMTTRRTKYPNDSFHDCGSLKPEVDAWIRQLEEKISCESPVFHLLQVIKSMLQCDLDKRLNSSGVLTHLRENTAFQIPIEPLRLKETRSHSGDWWEELKHELKLRSEPVVRLLLEKKAAVGPDYRDRNGWTILDHAATIDGSGSMVHLLLKGSLCTRFSSEALSTALCKAVRSDNEKAVSLLLEEGANPNNRDINGFTVLEEAAYHGKTTMVHLILEKGLKAGQEISANNLSTALCWGSRYGDEKIVSLILSKGADVSFVGEDRRTALKWAVLMGHEPVARLLLEAGADINYCIEGGLTVSRNQGSALAVDEPMTAIEKVAYQKNRIEKGLTLLEEAAYRLDKVMVSLLLEKRLHPGVSNFIVSKVLCVVSWNGKEELVRILLEKGVDEMHMNEESNKALVKAVLAGHEPVVRLLLEKGADPNYPTGKRTILMTAVYKGHESVVCLLLERQADPNSICFGDNTVLSFAIAKEKWSMVYLLLDKAVDPEFSIESFSEALTIAATTADEKLVSLLLEKGADIKHHGKTGNTALILAAARGHLAITQLLLEKGADVKDENNHRQTPLLVAAFKGHLGIVQLLLKAGADPKHPSDNGSMALSVSVRLRFPGIYKLLQQSSNVCVLLPSSYRALE